MAERPAPTPAAVLAAAIETIPVRIESDIVAAWTIARAMARAQGFNSTEQGRLATAVLELTRNVLNHAGEGICVLSVHDKTQGPTVKVAVEDRGPGIADVAAALEDGYSTGAGLGGGLPGTKRLVDTFEIVTGPGGTLVMIGVGRRAR